MEIKKEEWIDFAEFIARQSEHMCSQYWEDGTYIKCPYSTIERAYNAFQVYQQAYSASEVKKFWDVDVESANPETMRYDGEVAAIQAEEEDYYWNLMMEADRGQAEAAGLIWFDMKNWQPEWDNYCADREKQITRIAHELADKHENLPIFGDKSWMSLVYPFYEKYELNSDERCLFTQEYYSQHFFRYGYV